MSDSECETTDVVICGCGPTGAMLSAYLGQMNVPNIVLEKGTEITTDPRGIALDEDGIRLLQGLGLYSSIYSKIGTCESQDYLARPKLAQYLINDRTGMHEFRFIGGTDPVLDKKAFIEMNYGTVGYPDLGCYYEPALQ